MKLIDLAGVYDTGLGRVFEGRGRTLTPLVVGTDGVVRIGGAIAQVTFDEPTGTLTIQSVQSPLGPQFQVGRLVFNVDVNPSFQGWLSFYDSHDCPYHGNLSAFLKRPTLAPSSISALTSHITTKRATHQAPPLAWDAAIAMVAQGWANHNIDSYLLTFRNDPGNWSGLLQHSTNPYGENIYVESGQLFDAAYVESASIRAVDNWYSEVSNYDFTPPGGKSLPGKGVFGHFTCLVWKASITFGIGVSALVDPANRVLASVVVLNTSPAGNVAGQYDSNVLPAV